MTVTMTARDIRLALASRWPDAEYQRIEEAPQSSDRQGRKIDVLVISLWRSRGHELDAVEIKVSGSDWKRELKEPGKADWWWAHAHRYWIACPAFLVPRIRPELPSTWGLIGVDDGGCKTVVAAPKHEREPFTWEQSIGLIRAAADAGPNMLARARNEGYSAGVIQGKIEGTRHDPENHARESLAALTEVVRQFEAASGLSIRDGFSGGAKVGALVKMLMSWEHDPARIVRGLGSAVSHMETSAKALREIAAQLSAEVVA